MNMTEVIETALRRRIESGNNEIVLKSTGDILSVYLTDSEEEPVQVYYCGNAYAGTHDLDLIGVWSSLNSFVKEVLV